MPQPPSHDLPVGLPPDEQLFQQAHTGSGVNRFSASGNASAGFRDRFNPAGGIANSPNHQGRGSMVMG
jgi:hypothetical protein